MDSDESADDFDTALLALDEEAIRAFFDRWGMFELLGTDALDFWRVVHFLRTTREALSPEARMLSRRWLREHGFDPDRATATSMSRSGWSSAQPQRALDGFLRNLRRARRS